MDNQKIIEAVGLTKNFRQPNGEAVPVLLGVDLEVAAGEMVAIMGPSGSGKSTLLHILGLMAKPDEGRLRLLGRDAALLTEQERDRLRRRAIGFLFQFNSLLEELTLRENLTLTSRVRSPEQSERRAALEIERLAEALGLTKRLGAYPRDLSVGECCRGNLIRSLLGSPELIFADEPTGNLDAKNAKNLIEEFLGLLGRAHAGPLAPPAIVLATHNGDVASQADRILVLSEGRLCLKSETNAL
ncbi:MAG: ABC transporter ATP-binding protein [Elusimicrobia bacterium]|nr:ABC transporter ATP-binding protein [Elusimicrobiota bacterium]